VDLLAIVHVRAGVITGGALGEHDAGVGAVHLLGPDHRIADRRHRDPLGHLHVAPVDPVIRLVRHARFLRWLFAVASTISPLSLSPRRRRGNRPRRCKSLPPRNAAFASPTCSPASSPSGSSALSSISHY